MKIWYLSNWCIKYEKTFLIFDFFYQWIKEQRVWKWQLYFCYPSLYYIDDPGKIQEKGDLTNAYFPYKKVNIIYKSVLLLKKTINNLLVHLNKRRALNFDCLVITTIFFFFVWVKLWTLDFHYIITIICSILLIIFNIR